MALKFLPTGTRTPRQLRHLQELTERELEVHRRLRQPRLIRMYETRTVDDPAEPSLDGATVLVLEKAAGSLDKLLSRCPRPVAGPALLAQIGEGLHQLHHAGWVHGDLKPGNVLLLADHTVRLGDFNMAAEIQGTHGYTPAFQTTDYTPPERLWAETGVRGQHIRTTADIWAFGVLAHVVLTGTHPLPGATPGARRDTAVRYARGDDELRLSPDLPDDWREIVTECLARTHEERAHLGAAELLRRVEKVTGAAPSPALPRRPFGRRSGHRPLTRRTRSSLRWGSVAAASVMCMLAMMHHGSSAQAAGYERCAIGHVCFFTEEDGKGEMCAWYDDEADWQSGFIICEWGRATAPKSVLNNGYPDDLPAARYYRGTDFQGPAGCLRPTERRNLEDGELIRSVQWLSDC
ncbi:protein kinase domain-containing protein [Streptomyces sp. NPDC055078]